MRMKIKDHEILESQEWSTTMEIPRGDQEHDYNHSQPQRSAVTKGWAESEIVFQGHRLLRQYVQGFQVPGF